MILTRASFKADAPSAQLYAVSLLSLRRHIIQLPSWPVDRLNNCIQTVPTGVWEA